MTEALLAITTAVGLLNQGLISWEKFQGLASLGDDLTEEDVDVARDEANEILAQLRDSD